MVYIKIKLFFIIFIFIWFFMPAGSSLAHDPIFMASPEAPGKGAFDFHTSIQTSKQGDERGFEIEQEFSYGFSRNLAMRLSLPYEREEKITDQGQEIKEGTTDPSVMFKWRFWDKDLPGVKYSSGLILESTIPTGRGEGKSGRDKPGVMTGITHGREGLKWYYVVDARYLYNVEDNGNKPGDKLYLDVAYGIRPELRGLEGTDIVYFFEFNYMKENKSLVNNIDNPDSGGDFLFFSPEILISPANWIMLRGGVQIPVIQNLNGKQAPKDNTMKLVAEFRY